MTEPNEFHRIEQRLRAAFRDHAESVEPSPDAYARLARRLSDADVGRRRAAFPTYVRPLGYAAALLVAFGLSGYVLTQRGSQTVESADGAPAALQPSDVIDEQVVEPTDEEPADESSADLAAGNPDAYRAGDRGADPAEAVGETDTTVTGGEVVESDPQRRVEGRTYAPPGQTAVDAAAGFLRFLEVSDVEIVALDMDDSGDDDKQRFEVRAAGTDGDRGRLLTTLVVARTAGAFVVEEARSVEYDFAFVDPIRGDLTDDEIDDPVALVNPDSVVLTGSTARSFTVDLVPVIPGTIEWSASEGAAEDATIIGASRAWVVVGDRSDPAAPFSAKPAYVIGNDDPSVYTVVGLPPSDPDGGLVLRAEPNRRRIGVIPLGSTGVARRTVAPRLVDGLIWWAVTAPDGADGWVAADYLAPNDPVDPERLTKLARDLATAAVGTSDLPDAISFDYPVYVGSLSRPQLMRRGLENPNAWSNGRTTTGRSDGVDRPLTEFYGMDRWATAKILVSADYVDPAAARSASAYFGALPSVAIETTDPESGDRLRVRIYVSNRIGESGIGERLAILGIVLETEPGNDAGENGAGGIPSGPVPTEPDTSVDETSARAIPPDSGDDHSDRD